MTCFVEEKKQVLHNYLLMRMCLQYYTFDQNLRTTSPVVVYFRSTCQLILWLLIHVFRDGKAAIRCEAHSSVLTLHLDTFHVDSNIKLRMGFVHCLAGMGTEGNLSLSQVTYNEAKRKHDNWIRGGLNLLRQYVQRLYVVGGVCSPGAIRIWIERFDGNWQTLTITRSGTSEQIWLLQTVQSQVVSWRYPYMTQRMVSLKITF